MFNTVYEQLIGTRLRVRIVRNDRSKLYLDVRMLTEKGYNTTSGIFLPSEEVQQFFIQLNENTSSDSYAEYSLGTKNKLFLKKVGSNGSITALISRRPGSFDLSGVYMSAQEFENLKNQISLLASTIEAQQSEYPPLVQSNATH